MLPVFKKGKNLWNIHVKESWLTVGWLQLRMAGQYCTPVMYPAMFLLPPLGSDRRPRRCSTHIQISAKTASVLPETRPATWLNHCRCVLHHIVTWNLIVIVPELIEEMQTDTCRRYTVAPLLRQQSQTVARTLPLPYCCIVVTLIHRSYQICLVSRHCAEMNDNLSGKHIFLCTQYVKTGRNSWRICNKDWE